jgi:uracil phosphoribosyltransferase
MDSVCLSAVDAMMLEKADRSFVVLDDRNNRSLAPYLKVWRGQNKKVFQIDVFGAGFFHPCIEIAKLDELAKELATYDGGADCRSRVIDISTECMAALVLATQSRRSDLSGLALQQVHVEAGKFLADHWMNSYPDTLLEIAKFGHVQGNQFAGPVTSSQVMIVPLMRGGEPLARGVFERFPRASFVHYFEDEKGEPSDDRLTNCISKDNSIRHIAIVDSVINEGNSVRRVLNRITNEVGSPPRFRISVLTLVIQEQASVRLAEQYPSVRFVTLRTSQNKYKGKGGTDTGNRLFGTM